MSYGGFEYGGGFEAMGGYGFGGFGGGDTGGGFISEEKGAKSSEKKSRDRQGLMPLTIKQLLNSKGPDEVFKVDDVELNTVKLIGALLDPHDHSTNFAFKLDDGSGIIECKQWIDRDSGAPSPLANVATGSFVKVVGNVREFEGKMHVQIFSASEIHDWNEVSYHMLDTILTHLQNTRGPLQSNTAAMGQQSFGYGTPGGAGYSSYSAGPIGSVQGKMGMNQAVTTPKDNESLPKKIFQAYLSSTNQTGLGYEEVLRVLRSQNINITLDQLIKYVQELCDAGRLYTTIDDEHYCTTSDEY